MNLATPKNPPFRSEAHLDHIRSLPCCCCGAPAPSEAAHFRLGLGGGMGFKPGDDLTIPMCHAHHAKQHQMGEHLFWATRLSTDRQLLVQVMRAFCRSFLPQSTE